MPRDKPPSLMVIDTAPAKVTPPVPKHLDEVGSELWRTVTELYAFDDPASLEVLAQACAARSRAAKCAALIDQHGEMVKTR